MDSPDRIVERGLSKSYESLWWSVCLLGNGHISRTSADEGEHQNHHQHREPAEQSKLPTAACLSNKQFVLNIEAATLQ